MPFLSTITARSATSHEPLLHDLLARFTTFEEVVAAKAVSSSMSFAVDRVVDHARGTSLWLRDLCRARGIALDDGTSLDVVVPMPDEAFLQHERDVVGRLARVAAAAGDDLLGVFCTRWLEARHAAM